MPDGTEFQPPVQYQQSSSTLSNGSDPNFSTCANCSSTVTDFYGPEFARGGDIVPFAVTVSITELPGATDCHRVVTAGCAYGSAEVIAESQAHHIFGVTSATSGQTYPTVPTRSGVPSLTWWNLVTDNGGSPPAFYQLAGETTFTVAVQLADNAAGLFSSSSAGAAGPYAFLQANNWGVALPFNIGMGGPVQPGEQRRIRQKSGSGGQSTNSSGYSSCIPCWMLKQLQGFMPTVPLEPTFSGANASNPPGSLGYGWSLGQAYTKVVIEQEGGSGPNYFDLYDGSGSFDRWTITNPGPTETYTALYADMYNQAFKNSDGTYTVVFQNLTLMNFHALDGSVMAGKVLSKYDNNGNSVTYSYNATTGFLTEIQDSDGHKLFFNTTRADGQPDSIYSQVNTTGPKNVSFTYGTSGASNNRLTTMMVNVYNPLGGGTTTSLSYGFTYDATTLQLATVTNPRGDIDIEFSYYTSGPNTGLVQYETHFIPSGGSPSNGLRKFTYNYTFNADGLSGTIQITDADLVNSTSRSTTNTYDRRGQVTQAVAAVAGAPGGHYTWAYQYYDTLNPYLLTKIIDPNLSVTFIIYDIYGNPTSVTEAMQSLDRTTTYTYTSVTFNGLSVRLLSVIQPPPVTVNGTVQNAPYGATQLTYDSVGNLIQVTSIMNTSGAFLITSYTRRSDGRITAITDRNGSDNGNNTYVGNQSGKYNGNVTNIAYTTYSSGVSNAGNISSITFTSGQTSPTPPAAPLSGLTFSWDLYDNLLTATDPNSNSVSNTWDSLNRLVQTIPLPPSGTHGQDYVNYVYSKERLDHIDLPNNSVTPTTSTGRRLAQFNYGSYAPSSGTDVSNRIGSIYGLPQPFSAPTTQQMIVGYTYDAYSNVLKLTRKKSPFGGSVADYNWIFGYDPLDRQISAQDPMSRTTSTNYPDVCLAYTQTTPRGIATTNSFDVLCELVHIENPGEDDAVTYDEWGRIIQIQQLNGTESEYSTGLSSAPAKFGSARYQDTRLPQIWTFLYDALSRLIKVTFPDSTTLQYVLANEGNITQVTDPATKVTSYTYYPYSDNRLQTITLNSQTWTYYFNLTVGSTPVVGAGRVVKIAYPNGLSALFYDLVNTPPEFGWDYKGQLLGINYVLSGTTLQSFAYLYDNSGNRLQCVDYFLNPGGSPITTTTTYGSGSSSPGYDGFNRLLSATQGGVTNSYGYDQSDNRTTAVLGSATYTSAYDAADELVSRALSGGGTDTFTPDADGNLLSKTVAGVTKNYVWDDKSKLARIQDGSYTSLQFNAYEVGGLRRESGETSPPTVTYYNSGATAIADSWSSPSPYGPLSFIQGHQILGMEENGNILSYITDALGSVRHVLDSSGSIKYSFSYDEFGNATGTDRTGGSPAYLAGLCQLLTYVGGYGVRNEVGTSGYLLMGQRFYDPTTGRFINQDPQGFSGGLNFYGYAGQSPVNFSDPSGLFTFGGVARGVGDSVGGAVLGIVLLGSIGLFAGIAPVGAALAAGSLIIAGGIGIGQQAYQAGSGRLWQLDGNGRVLSEEEQSVALGQSLTNVVFLGAGLVKTSVRPPTQLEINEANGAVAEARVNQALKESGYADGDCVLRSQAKRYPWGRKGDVRIVDYEIGNGKGKTKKPWFRVEVKSGNSRYHASQRAGDIQLELRDGAPTFVVRLPNL